MRLLQLRRFLSENAQKSSSNFLFLDFFFFFFVEEKDFKFFPQALIPKWIFFSFYFFLRRFSRKKIIEREREREEFLGGKYKGHINW